jgi:two-component system, OmpR family, response regulator ChvI
MTAPHFTCSRCKAAIAGPALAITEDRRVSWRGVDVNLSHSEYLVVMLLSSEPGKYRTYRAIYDVMRPPGFIAGDGDEGFKANVRSLIKRIRRKFQRVDPGFDEINNYSSVGYGWKEG